MFDQVAGCELLYKLVELLSEKSVIIVKFSTTSSTVKMNTSSSSSSSTSRLFNNESLKFANDESRLYYESLNQRNQKTCRKTFIMIAVTSVLSIIIIGVFFAVLVSKMTDKKEGLESKVENFFKNTSDWIKSVFPPRTGSGQASGINMNMTALKNASKPIILFGEGNGFNLNRILTVAGEVIHNANQSLIKSQQEKRNLYHTN